MHVVFLQPADSVLDCQPCCFPIFADPLTALTSNEQELAHDLAMHNQIVDIYQIFPQ